MILEAYREYGEDCVQHFNGQWAFGIWDTCSESCSFRATGWAFARCSTRRRPNSFLFASEIKALLACPDVAAEIDLRGLDQIFTFWATLPPRTSFKNISSCRRVTRSTIEDGQIRIQAVLVTFLCGRMKVLATRMKTRLAEELLDLLQDATRIRLRSDVPVGAYLSGGIDSTVTTALVKKLVGDRLRSFSISFEDAEFDESSFQQEASAFLGTQAHQRVLHRQRYRRGFSAGDLAYRASGDSYRAGAHVFACQS